MEVEEDESLTFLLDVYMPKAKDFMNVLRAMSFREHCWLRFFPNGLRLIIDDEVEMQGNAYFKTDFFSEYNIRASDVTIYIKSKILMQAMNMFQEGAFSARMIYKDLGDMLEIHMESSTMDAKVSVPTVAPTQILNIHCDNSSLPVKVIFSPNFLSEILADLDPAVQTVKLEFKRDRLIVETVGEIFQQTEIRRCDENIEDFVVVNALDSGVVVCFRSDHLRKLPNILKSAKRVAVKVDSNGVICFQIIVEHEENIITYIEFLLFRTVLNEDLAEESTTHNATDPAQF